MLVVWEPILQLDSEQTGRRATRFFPDPRVRQFWAPSTATGEAFQPAIELTTEPAWDVYLFYGKGTKWRDQPPRPRDFMRQLSGRLPSAKRLDGESMATKLSSLLKNRTK